MRFTKAVLLTLGALLLGGCWDRLELNDMASIRMFGVDKADEGVRLSTRITVPTRIRVTGGGGGGGGGQTEGAGGAAHMSTVVYSAEGRTVLDAAMKLQEMVPRRLFWGHAGPLVISAEYAREEGLNSVLDFFSRHRQPRLSMYVVISEGPAMDFNLAKPSMERIIGESVREIINQRLQTVIRLKDLIITMRSPGQHPVLPMFRVTPGVPGGPEIEVRVVGTAIFRHDRLIGFLDDAQTRGLLWLRNEIQVGVVTVSVPSGGRVSLQLIRGRTDVLPDWSTGRLRIHVVIDTEDDIFESSAPIDFGKEETVLLLERLLAEALRQRIEPVVEKVQHEYRVDAFRFAEAVRRTAPALWENRLKEKWNQEFPKVPIDLQIKAKIRRTGMHGAPLWGSDKEIKANQAEFLKQMR